MVSNNPLKNMAKSAKKVMQLQKSELSISMTPNKDITPFAFNYYDVKINSQDCLNFRMGKVTCCIICYLISLGGQKEHFHYLGL